jgi:hypothetical protein
MVKCLKTEAWLIDKGFKKFTLRTKVPVTDIDMQDARSNTARPHRPVDTDVAVRYATAMEAHGNADAFPPLVLIKSSLRRQLRMATGLHRIDAGSMVKPKPVEEFDAYIVDCDDDPARETLLIHAINSIEGNAPTVDQELLLAAEYKHLYPDTSIKEVAAAFSIKELMLSNFLKQQDGERRASRLECLAEFQELKTQALKLGLNRVQNDNTFKRSVVLAFVWKLNGSEADAFTNDVLKCRTEAQANDLIDKREEEYKRRAAKLAAPYAKPQRTKWQKMVSWCKMVMRLDVPSLGLSQVPDGEVAGTMMAYETAAEHLQRATRILRARHEAMSRKQNVPVE